VLALLRLSAGDVGVVVGVELQLAELPLAVLLWEAEAVEFHAEEDHEEEDEEEDEDHEVEVEVEVDDGALQVDDGV
jgi:hypothetical protein